MSVLETANDLFPNLVSDLRGIELKASFEVEVRAFREAEKLIHLVGSLNGVGLRVVLPAADPYHLLASLEQISLPPKMALGFLYLGEAVSYEKTGPCSYRRQLHKYDGRFQRSLDDLKAKDQDADERRPHRSHQDPFGHLRCVSLSPGRSAPPLPEHRDADRDEERENVLG